MVGHALMVLQDLLEDADHACTFTLADGACTGDDVSASVDALLPEYCRVTALEPLNSWSAQVREVLPGLFVPSTWSLAPADWSTPRELAGALANWSVALLGRLWPESAESWSVTVEADDWYEAVYVDTAVRTGGRVWLLHLGVTD
jgi:hypothetical protein